MWLVSIVTKQDVFFIANNMDKDLQFIQNADNEDLHVLIDYLTKDKDGEVRVTEELTQTQIYKNSYPEHLNAMSEQIADELCRFGGNTIANIFRGGGVSYKELLCDVCDKMKVNYNKSATIEMIESNLLMKVMTDSLEKMSPEELKQLVQELNLKTTDFTKQAIVVAMQMGVKFSGFMVYRMAVIVANWVAKAILGRGLAFAGNMALTRGIAAFAGPIGWILTILWTAYDIAGPAYRVTIPSVIQVAYMRAKMTYGEK